MPWAMVDALCLSVLQVYEFFCNVFFPLFYTLFWQSGYCGVKRDLLWSRSNIVCLSWLCRIVSQVDYPSLVDLRGLLLDLVAQLLGALSRIR